MTDAHRMSLAIVGRSDDARQLIDHGARAFRIDQLTPDRRDAILAAKGLAPTPPEGQVIEEWLRHRREEDEETRLSVFRKIVALPPIYRLKVATRRDGRR